MSANTKNTETTGPTHPTGDMLTAHLLAMLKGWLAYGYDLAQRLNEAGFGDYNKGTVYRALRHTEDLGLVSSMWDTSSSGPARRIYKMTQAGNLFLTNWLALIDMHRSMVEHFLYGARPTAEKDVAGDAVSYRLQAGPRYAAVVSCPPEVSGACV